MNYCGFSVGGASWLQHELSDARDENDRAKRLTQIGFEESRLTSSVGGNALRLFYTHGTLTRPFGSGHQLLVADWDEAFHLLPLKQKVQKFNQAYESLAGLLEKILGTDARGEGLNFTELDHYLAGVITFNRSCGEREARIGILLTHVSTPPYQLVEAPGPAALAGNGGAASFDEAFHLYHRINQELARRIVRRLVVSLADSPVVAIEIDNEPDYIWLPDEVRIERSRNKSASPTGKYITELHRLQMPGENPSAYYEKTPWGYQEQTGGWTTRERKSRTGVLEHDWGAKFDWYVWCYATTAAHYSYALWHESRAHDARIDIVAAGVTHNNLDYLVRMHKEVPTCYDHCTAIAFHPYHWPEHNVSDTRFRDRQNFDGWRSATPREFADKYFKVFDFFRVAHELTSGRDPELKGFAGKAIWLTEFGIGSKVMGKYNTDSYPFVPFIRPRALPASALPHESVVWEDLWDEFFRQITPDFLQRHGVRGFFVYSLRETPRPAFDKHDDDRSNMAVLSRNGSPRLERETFLKFRSFMEAITGNADVLRRGESLPFRLSPPWARWRDHSSALVGSRPWRATSLPESVRTCMTMLSTEERQLLQWSTENYYQGKGAIVDAGCFVGGSTLALGAGLQRSWPEANHVIHSYDMFEAEPYMVEHYFKPQGLPLNGTSFRDAFDRQTREIAGRVVVHAGDITEHPWCGQPVEILFLDVCKAWSVNDFCTCTFFPRLLPGHSLVIHQDYFDPFQPWCALTMELLSDHFEYLALAEWNTALFRCTRAVPSTAIPGSLKSLGLATLEGLLRKAIARQNHTYEQGMLTAALAALFAQFGERTRAASEAERALALSKGHEVVKQRVALLLRDVIT